LKEIIIGDQVKSYEACATSRATREASIEGVQEGRRGGKEHRREARTSNRSGGGRDLKLQTGVTPYGFTGEQRYSTTRGEERLGGWESNNGSPGSMGSRKNFTMGGRERATTWQKALEVNMNKARMRKGVGLSSTCLGEIKGSKIRVNLGALQRGEDERSKVVLANFLGV